MPYTTMARPLPTQAPHREQHALNKKNLSESDICDKFIRPAMERAGWHGLEQIFGQYPLRAGRVVVRGNTARRDPRTVLRADYALFWKASIPLATVEAKTNDQAMGAGMPQAIRYAELLQVPFSFSSNGDGFVFRDATLSDGVLERNLALDEFPSPAELWARYCAWKGWSPEVQRVAAHAYQPGKTPRYYQINAINRTVEAIAAGQNRVLLVMATGTGKTFVAFQTIWRLWKSGAKKRILFLADRNILIDQTMVNDFRPFKGAMAKLSPHGKGMERMGDDGHSTVEQLPLATRQAPLVQHFDLLTSAPGGVVRLRELILTLAVQGKLVPQDPADEPASALLERIAAEKARLVAVGKIKKGKPLAGIAAGEMPFELPAGWEWVRVRMGELVNASEAGWSPTCLGSPRTPGKWGVLKVSAVSWGSFDPEANKELPADLLPRPQYEVKNGDFLLSRANTEDLVARSVVVGMAQPQLMLSDKIIRLEVSSQVNREFLNFCNNSQHVRSYYKASASGTSSSMKNVSREVVLNALIPLPPLPEQSRIVARVESLRRLCTDLRQRLTVSQTTQAQLAEALVANNASSLPSAEG